jgi:RND superfamily putative drug exporter
VRRTAELVLHHRKLVMVAWLVLLVAGIIAAGQATKRLVIDFSLPGQPGTTAAQKIIAEFGNGGNTTPYLLTLTAPAGQTVTGHEAQVAEAFRATAAAVPHTRVVDGANTGDPFFRTKDGRTAFAMVFYQQPRSFTEPQPVVGLTAGVT